MIFSLHNRTPVCCCCCRACSVPARAIKWKIRLNNSYIAISHSSDRNHKLAGNNKKTRLTLEYTLGIAEWWCWDISLIRPRHQESPTYFNLTKSQTEVSSRTRGISILLVLRNEGGQCRLVHGCPNLSDTCKPGTCTLLIDWVFREVSWGHGDR